MKPTRSEIRGTWLLAAVCAVALLLAALIAHRSADVRVQSAEPLSEISESSGNTEALDSVSGRDNSAAERSNRGRAAKSPKGRAPRPVPKDNPSPLDRPM